MLKVLFAFSLIAGIDSSATSPAQFTVYELVANNAKSIAPVPNSKRVACPALAGIQIFPSLLLTVKADAQAEPCKLFDQLGVNPPWNKLEASLYGKKPDSFAREEPSGYPMLYTNQEFSDKYGGHWEVGVDPNYSEQGVDVRDKTLVVDKTWKFRHLVHKHPNYKIEANGGQILSVAVQNVDNNQHMAKVDQSRVQKMVVESVRPNAFGPDRDPGSASVQFNAAASQQNAGVQNTRVRLPGIVQVKPEQAKTVPPSPVELRESPDKRVTQATGERVGGVMGAGAGVLLWVAAGKVAITIAAAPLLGIAATVVVYVAAAAAIGYAGYWAGKKIGRGIAQ